MPDRIDDCPARYLRWDRIHPGTWLCQGAGFLLLEVNWFCPIPKFYAWVKCYSTTWRIRPVSG